MIVMFVGYTVVRGIIQAENVEVKKNILKWTGITAGGIAGAIAVGHFFGAIGLIAISMGGMLAYSDR